MEQPSDQDAQDQQFLDQQDIPPDEPQAPNGEAERNAPGLNAQGHGAVGLALSPPRPPPVDDGPFTQADKINMARLQQSLSTVQSDQFSGRITKAMGYRMRQRVSEELGPLMAKQKRWQQQQQQEAQQAMLGQAAQQEAISNVHLQRRAQGFAGTMSEWINPATGQRIQFAPKMGPHGQSEMAPIYDEHEGVGESGTPQAIDDQELLRRAQQRFQPPAPPQFIQPPRFGGRGAMQRVEFHNQQEQRRYEAQLQSYQKQVNGQVDTWKRAQALQQQQAVGNDFHKQQMELKQQQMQMQHDHQAHIMEMREKMLQMQIDQHKAQVEMHQKDMDAKLERRGEIEKEYHGKITAITKMLSTPGKEPGDTAVLPTPDKVAEHLKNYYPYIWNRMWEIREAEAAQKGGSAPATGQPSPQTGISDEEAKGHAKAAPTPAAPRVSVPGEEGRHERMIEHWGEGGMW